MSTKVTLLWTFEILVTSISRSLLITTRPCVPTAVSRKFFLPRIRLRYFSASLTTFITTGFRNWFSHIWFGFLLVCIDFTAESSLINKYHECFRVYIWFLIYVSRFCKRKTLSHKACLCVCVQSNIWIPINKTAFSSYWF